MARACRFERSLLSFDEYEAIRITHHPAVQKLTDDDLRNAAAGLREMRDKERTHARQKRRESRGKADARGSGFPGTFEKPLQRKQVFAAAVKRANKEATRRRNAEARASNIEAAHRALALRRRGGKTNRPEAGQSANQGMRPAESSRREQIVQPAAVGSITKATKISQAIRDSRS